MTTRLRVVIIGGGIAGLSTAIALARRGTTSVIYERSPGLQEIGAGIILPPNATRIFHSWGLLAQLEEISTPLKANRTRRYATGEVLSEMKDVSNARYGFPQLTVYRPDLHKVLYDSALAHGVNINFGKCLEMLDLTTSTLTFDDGNRVQADIIIGADGVRSSIRRTIMQDHGDDFDPQLSPLCVYRALIPAEKIQEDPDLLDLFEDPVGRVWMGPSFVAGVPIANNRYYNLAFHHKGKAALGVWSEPGDMVRVREIYKDFEPMTQKLLDRVVTPLKWALADLPPLPTWSSKNKQVVLIGDSAHAMLPNAAQGAAQAVEDAAVLAECLAAVKIASELAKAVDLYERARKPRVETLAGIARSNNAMLSVPNGPAQEGRDYMMKEMRQMQQQQAPVNGQMSGERPKPDMMAPFSSPPFMEWLYGDVVEGIGGR